MTATRSIFALLVLFCCAVTPVQAAGPGQLDPGFWSDGTLELGWNVWLYQVGLRSDGGIVALEGDRTELIWDNALSLYNTKVRDAMGGSAVTDDDRLVTVRNVRKRDGSLCLQVRRFETDLTPDATFGTGGAAIGHCLTGIADNNPGFDVNQVAIGRAGDIYIVGRVPSGGAYNSPARSFLAVFSADGGKSKYLSPVQFTGQVPPPPASSLTSIVVRPEGGGGETLWVAGWYSHVDIGGSVGVDAFAIARLDTAGNPAPGFGPPVRFVGASGSSLGFWVRLAPAPGGGVYVAGALLPDDAINVFELEGDGSRSTTFGVNGMTRFDFAPGARSYLCDLATKPGRGGGLYVYGASVPDDGSLRSYAVRAIDGNGHTDTAFHGSGYPGNSLLPPPPTAELAQGLRLLEGGILVRDDKLLLGEFYYGGASPAQYWSRLTQLQR